MKETRTNSNKRSAPAKDRATAGHLAVAGVPPHSASQLHDASDWVLAAFAASASGREGTSPSMDWARDSVDVQPMAELGVSGSATTLPFAQQIQNSFGKHDISSIRAHGGTEAAEANEGMGSIAYATGQDISFGSAPDLHTAAHEAAHVVQQRGGVQLKSGVGQPGDSLERHADLVADAVVRGESAEALLDPYSGGGAGSAAVQPGQLVQHAGRSSASCDNPGTVDIDSVEAVYAQIASEYRNTMHAQRDAIDALRDAAATANPQSGWEQVALALCRVALATATKGISEVVAGRLVREGAQLAHTLVQAGIESSLQQGMELVSGSAGNNVRDAFFHTQRDFCRVAGEDAERDFNLRGRGPLSRGDDPVAAAFELLCAVREGRAAATSRQRQATLAAWCNLLAQLERGVHEPSGGADLSERVDRTVFGMGRPTRFSRDKLSGILRLQIRQGAYGQAVRITAARIGGLNDGLQAEMADRPIGDLGISLDVNGTGPRVTLGGFQRPRSPTLINFGANEQGAIWNGSTPNAASRENWGAMWLTAYGHRGMALTNSDVLGAADRLDPNPGIERLLDEVIRPTTLRSHGIVPSERG